MKKLKTHRNKLFLALSLTATSFILNAAGMMINLSGAPSIGLALTVVSLPCLVVSLIIWMKPQRQR